MAKSFEELVLPHYNAYMKLAIKWCYGDRHKAEDMVQEAMIKAYTHFDKYDERYKASTWFGSILRNIILDHQKHEERMNNHWHEYFIWKHSYDPFYSLDLSEEQETLNEFVDKIPDLMNSLSPIDQTIVQMFMAGQSYSDIATALGTSRNATNQRMRRICKQLREELLEETC